MQDEVYTLGAWIVKPGFEAQFKQAWSEFAKSTKASFAGAISAVLLQDTTNPRRFISVGPWRSERDIAEWRASEAFAEAIARIKPMLESFEPGSFWPVYKAE
jgi:heme-degrading monooxygenase HmoA